LSYDKPLVRLWLISAFTLLGACSFSPALPALPERASLPLSSAVDRAYEEVLAAPADPAANGDLAASLHRLGSFEYAETAYQRAFLLDPENFRWLYLIGSVQASQDNYAPAAASLRHALRVEPSYLPAKLQLAALALRMGAPAETERLCREILEGEAGRAEAAYWLGRAQAEGSRFADAIESYRLACESFPAFGEAHWHWGFAASRLSDQDAAQEHFTLSVRHKFETPELDDPVLGGIRGEPTRAVQLLREAYLLEERGADEEARRAYLETLQLDPRMDAAHARLIRLENERGVRKQVIQHYEEALRLNPLQDDAHSNFGFFLLGEERFQEARRSFEQALKLNPYHPEALTHLGSLMDRYEQPEEAERNFRLAIQTRPDYREARFRLGSLLNATGRRGEAVEQFQAVASVEDRKTPMLLYRLSAEYVRAGDRQAAFNCLRRAHELAKEYGQLDLADRIQNERRFF